MVEEEEMVEVVVPGEQAPLASSEVGWCGGGGVTEISGIALAVAREVEGVGGRKSRKSIESMAEYIDLVPDRIEQIAGTPAPDLRTLNLKNH